MAQLSASRSIKYPLYQPVLSIDGLQLGFALLAPFIEIKSEISFFLHRILLKKRSGRPNLRMVGKSDRLLKYGFHSVPSLPAYWTLVQSKMEDFLKTQ